MGDGTTSNKSPAYGKRLLKRCARAMGAFRAGPVVVSMYLLRPIVGAASAFVGGSERISRVPGMLGVYARQAFYRGQLAGLGTDVYIGMGTLMSKPDARMGDRVYIGRYCTVGNVAIEADVMIADGVQLLSGGHQHGARHDAARPLRDNPHAYERITIGKGAWIGANAVVMADVGAGAIVGAGAVVTRPIMAGMKVAGVPARPMTQSTKRAA